MIYNIYGDINMEIREIRLSKGISQQEAADLLGLSLRTYQNYEYEKSNRDKFKIEYIKSKLNEYTPINETKGIYKLKDIKKIVCEVLSDTNITYAYLFGSYAMETAKEDSNINILISGELRGLDFIKLIFTFKEKFHKKIELIKIDEIINNKDYINNILIHGIKIYSK